VQPVAILVFSSLVPSLLPSIAPLPCRTMHYSYVWVMYSYGFSLSFYLFKKQKARDTEWVGPGVLGGRGSLVVHDQVQGEKLMVAVMCLASSEPFPPPPKHPPKRPLLERTNTGSPYWGFASSSVLVHLRCRLLVILYLRPYTYFLLVHQNCNRF
jgi:hypothetical protein